MAGTYVYEERPEAYRAFQRNSSWTESAARYLKREAYSLFTRPQEGEFVIVDVGCGNGKVLLPVVEFLNLFGSCRVYAVEPSAALLEEFKAEAQRRGVRNITFVNADWMGYQPKEKADLVVCSHTIYYMEPREATKKMADALKPNGRVCVSFMSQEKGADMIMEFHQQFYRRVSAPDVHNPFMDSVFDIIEDLGMEHRTDVVRSTINLKPSKEQTEEGKRMLEFFLHRPLDGLPAGLVDEIRLFLLKKPDVAGMETVSLWLWKEQGRKEPPEAVFK